MSSGVASAHWIFVASIYIQFIYVIVQEFISIFFLFLSHLTVRKWTFRFWFEWFHPMTKCSWMEIFQFQVKFLVYRNFMFWIQKIHRLHSFQMRSHIKFTGLAAFSVISFVMYLAVLRRTDSGMSSYSIPGRKALSSKDQEFMEYGDKVSLYNIRQLK